MGPWFLDLTELKHLNLSRTNLTGQLPPLNGGMPKLQQLDLSKTGFSGYLPPMPRNLSTCRLPTDSFCLFRDASWTDSAPKACLAGLKACSGDPPRDVERSMDSSRRQNNAACFEPGLLRTGSTLLSSGRSPSRAVDSLMSTFTNTGAIQAHSL